MSRKNEIWSTILKFIDEHPDLVTGRSCSFNGRSKSNVLWKDLTNQLNSLGYGIKSTQQWQKAWADFKQRTKNRAALIKKEQNKIGGEQNVIPPLNEFELKTLNAMGQKTISVKREIKFKVSEESNEALSMECSNNSNLSFDNNCEITSQHSTSHDDTTHLPSTSRPRSNSLGSNEIKNMHEEQLTLFNKMITNQEKMLKKIDTFIGLFQEYMENINQMP